MVGLLKMPSTNPLIEAISRVQSRVDALRGAWNGQVPIQLDDEIDGVMLRDLLTARKIADQIGDGSTFTQAQCAAISAHWSAQLRAKVAASAAADKARQISVTYCELDADD